MSRSRTVFWRAWERRASRERIAARFIRPCATRALPSVFSFSSASCVLFCALCRSVCVHYQACGRSYLVPCRVRSRAAIGPGALAIAGWLIALDWWALAVGLDALRWVRGSSPVEQRRFDGR